MIFRIVDFPAPLAPRMIFVWPVSSVKLTSFRMTFSSNASDTWSSMTTGAPGLAQDLFGRQLPFGRRSTARLDA